MRAITMLWRPDPSGALCAVVLLSGVWLAVIDGPALAQTNPPTAEALADEKVQQVLKMLDDPDIRARLRSRVAGERMHRPRRRRCWDGKLPSAIISGRRAMRSRVFRKKWRMPCKSCGVKSKEARSSFSSAPCWRWASAPMALKRAVSSVAERPGQGRRHRGRSGKHRQPRSRRTGAARCVLHCLRGRLRWRSNGRHWCALS